MKIMSVSKEKANNNSNMNFGLHNRCFINKRKLICYWRSKGFSYDCIQSSMQQLEDYANKDRFGFLKSLFGKKSSKKAKEYPAIDLLSVENKVITKVGTVVNAVTGSMDMSSTRTILPIISYKFEVGDLKIPFNTTFTTPLEKVIETRQGKVSEPIHPKKIVKEIIKNFKSFMKSADAD